MGIDDVVANLTRSIERSVRPVTTRVIHPVMRLENKVLSAYMRLPILTKHPALAIPAMAVGLPAFAKSFDYLLGGSVASPAELAVCAGIGVAAGWYQKQHFLEARHVADREGLDVRRFDALDDAAAPEVRSRSSFAPRRAFDYVLSHPRFNAALATAAVLSPFNLFALDPSRSEHLVFAGMAAGSMYVTARVFSMSFYKTFHSSASLTRKAFIHMIKERNPSPESDEFVREIEQLAREQPSRYLHIGLAQVYEQRGLQVEALLSLKAALDEPQVMDGAFSLLPGAMYTLVVRDVLSSPASSSLRSAALTLTHKEIGDLKSAQAELETYPSATLSDRVLKATLRSSAFGYEAARSDWQKVSEEIINHPSFKLSGGGESLHLNGYADIGDEIVSKTVYVVQAPENIVQQEGRWLPAVQSHITDAAFFPPRLLGAVLNGDESYLLYYLLSGKSAAQLAEERALTADQLAAVGSYMRLFHSGMPVELSSIGPVDLLQKYRGAAHAFPEVSELEPAAALMESLTGSVLHMDHHASQGLFGRHLGRERYAPFDLEDKGLRDGAWDPAKFITDSDLYVSGLSQEAVFSAVMEGYEASPEIKRDVLKAAVLQPILWAEVYLQRGLLRKVLPALRLVDNSVDLLRQDSGIEYVRNRAAIRSLQDGAHRAIDRLAI